MTETARSEAQQVTNSTWFRGFARGGYAASGIVQLLVGVLAVQIALHGSGQQASQSGALSSLAKAPGGAVVVWLVAIGGLALALWLVLDGILERGGDAKETWKARLKSWGKAVAYGTVGVTALRTALGSSGNSNRSTEEGSRTLLSLPGGQVLLVVLGLAVIGFGGYFVVRGVTKRFVKTIRVPPDPAGRAVVLLGQVGYSARGVALGAVGVLFVVAAVTTDPQKADGLDGALRAFADLPFGKVVLVVIGLGWVAAGVYTALRAKLARLD